MLIVSDVADVFVPLNSGFMVDPNESRLLLLLSSSSLVVLLFTDIILLLEP